jgi:hypothetical protein
MIPAALAYTANNLLIFHDIAPTDCLIGHRELYFFTPPYYHLTFSLVGRVFKIPIYSPHLMILLRNW